MISGLGNPANGLAQAAAGVRMRSFAGTIDQVRGARAFTARLLAGCPAADDAVQCVSEFSAHAVLHSASGGGGRFIVRVEVFAPDYSWVEVEDDGGLWPFPRAADLDGHGRAGDGRAGDGRAGDGLGIVGKVASEWGVDGDPDGWIAWARLDWRPAVIRRPGPPRPRTG